MKKNRMLVVGICAWCGLSVLSHAQDMVPVNGETEQVAASENVQLDVVGRTNRAPVIDTSGWRSSPAVGEVAPVAPPTFPWRSLMVTLLMLGALIYGHYWLRQRAVVQGSKGGGNERMRVRERLSLGPRRSILMLEVGGRRFLLADNPDHTVLLADLGVCSSENAAEVVAGEDEDA